MKFGKLKKIFRRHEMEIKPVRGEKDTFVVETTPRIVRLGKPTRAAKYLGEDGKDYPDGYTFTVENLGKGLRGIENARVSGEVLNVWVANS
jgi:hypothetical protein